MSSLGALQQIVQTARPIQPALAAAQCRHPTRPASLRKLCADFSEPCVELLVASTSSGMPCCILPRGNPAARDAQAHGLFRLLDLTGLNEHTVVDRLAAVEGHVANTCSACPMQDGQQQPSPLVYCPELSCFLERCLELAQMQKQLGLAPTVLLLQIVSRLNYSADESLRANFSRYYLHLQVELGSAVELHSEAITPQVALAVFEAWARLGALPMHSRPFGLAVRDHIKAGRFTPAEMARLLAAKAKLRVARSSYRPCQYDIADICNSLLSSGLPKLATSHLSSVAASLGAFPWPVYQCVLPLLEAVAQEGVRRQAAGEMSPAASSALVATALGSAAALNLRFGAELEAKVAGWQNQARLATGGNILGFASAGASTAEEPAYSR